MRWRINFALSQHVNCDYLFDLLRRIDPKPCGQDKIAKQVISQIIIDGCKWLLLLLKIEESLLLSLDCLMVIPLANVCPLTLPDKFLFSLMRSSILWSVPGWEKKYKKSFCSRLMSQVEQVIPGIILKKMLSVISDFYFYDLNKFLCATLKVFYRVSYVFIWFIEILHSAVELSGSIGVRF